jgi:outer membrane protein OmpA-like peptidoglycan-associated protein
LAFDDVYFDYDEATLSESAAQVLDRAVLAMQTNTTFRLTIEGNTCSIGTAESNLALGSRRANTVRDYLISQGIDGNRLFTVSFGEERPTFDNEREDTRRMNRRASLVAETRQSARLP